MLIEFDNIEQATAIRDAVGEWLMAMQDHSGWDSESLDALVSGHELLVRAIRQEVRDRGY